MEERDECGTNPKGKTRQGDFFWFAEMGPIGATNWPLFRRMEPGVSARRLTSYNLQEDAHPNNGGTGL